MTFDEIRQIALSFPGVEEHTILGGPTFKVGKRFLASTAKIDADSLVLKVPDAMQRDFLMKTKPEVYYNTDHYADFGSILIRMSKVELDEFRELFEQAWRTFAPKRLVANYNAAG